MRLGLVALTASAQGIESVLRPGELIRGHAKWEDDCGQCHVRFKREAQNGQCMDCHKDIGADVRNSAGMHGRLKPQACRECHTDHKGRDARIASLDETRFDHRLSDYLLRGKHVAVACAACHVAGRKYSQAPQACDSCHRKDDVHKGSLGAGCGDCHQEADWKQAKLDHAKTRFALSGKHVDVKCDACHKNAVFTEAPQACVACHRKDDDGVRGHKGRFGDKCETCHDAKGWKPSTFKHDTATRYALLGRHRDTTCSACHKGTLYRDKLGTGCVDCHRADDKHKESLGTECQSCHVETRWSETRRFDHGRTKFVLRGKHTETKCTECHKTTSYKVAQSTCVACHRKDDSHRPSLGEQCEACHVEVGWKDLSRFDHARSRFALRGRHLEAKCGDCHKTPAYRATATDCIACHRKDDKHEGTLGTACADCHGEADWKRTPRFDHQRTRFPLRNAHAAKSLQCQGCHADLRKYRPTPLDCQSCHRKDDKHEGQLGQRCDSCHIDTRWSDTSFDHARARFVLVGRHLRVSCKDCHQSVRYRDAARDCVGCHRKDDKHEARLGAACQNCHNARDWRLWTFDHDRTTSFVLDGAHKPLACDKCHRAPAPAGQAIASVGDTCAACHRRDDKHDGAFGARCDQCHVSSDWKRLRGRPTPGSRSSTVPQVPGPSGWSTRVASRRPS